MSEYYSAYAGGYSFKFELVEQYSGEIRIYIVSSPAYGRDSCLHKTHRLSDSGKYYVCVRGDLIPNNFNDARNWAQYWAKGTVNYIKFGTPFS